jgi:hypothetical protein
MAELVESEPSIKHPIEIVTNEHGVGLISSTTIYAALIVRFNTLLKVMYQEPQVRHRNYLSFKRAKNVRKLLNLLS